MNVAPVKKPRAARQFHGLSKAVRLDHLTPQTRRTAACVLEVLAGVRTPEQAAKALELSLPTYYNTEMRALRGLMAGCSSETLGRPVELTSELKAAQARIASLDRQLQRYQALLRASQRSVGLAPPAPPPPKKPGGRRKKPSVRALRVVRALREGVETSPGGGPSTGAAADPFPAAPTPTPRAVAV